MLGMKNILKHPLPEYVMKKMHVRGPLNVYYIAYLYVSDGCT